MTGMFPSAIVNLEWQKGDKEMRKLSFLLFILFSVFIGGILLWQWEAYSSKFDGNEDGKKETAVQHISVEVEKGFLNITQKITGLKTGKGYPVNIPEMATKWSCLKEDGTDCESVGENPHSFVANGEALQFLLTIPYNDKQAFLLNDWIVKVQNAEIANTEVDLVDSSVRKGFWLAGLEFKGKKELEYIDYYSYEGNHPSPSLYWQPTIPEHQKVDGPVALFFSGGDQTLSYTFSNLENISDFPHTNIIFTNDYKEIYGEGIIVFQPGAPASLVEQKLAGYYFSGKGLGKSEEEKWLSAVLASLYLGTECEYEKGNQIKEELAQNFAPEQLEQFMQTVIADKGTVDAEKLDGHLGELVSGKTFFFRLNKNINTKIVPFYFAEPQTVIIGKEEYDNIEIIHFRGNRMLPFIETMEALEFETALLPEEQSILVKDRDRNIYRFYKDGGFFILNEEHFGLMENPLAEINGKIYIKEEWLEEIFSVHIKESNGEIIITK